MNNPQPKPSFKTKSFISLQKCIQEKVNNLILFIWVFRETETLNEQNKAIFFLSLRFYDAQQNQEDLL